MNRNKVLKRTTPLIIAGLYVVYEYLSKDFKPEDGAHFGFVGILFPVGAILLGPAGVVVVAGTTTITSQK